MTVAYDRLNTGYYNNALKSVANPGGFSGAGALRVNFPLFLADFCAVGAEAAASAQLAQTAATGALGGASTTGTSTSNTSIPAVGAVMTITIQAGKSLVAGMKGVITRTSTPTTSAAYGTIQSYNTGTGVLQMVVEETVTTGGAGPFVDWTFGLSGFGVPKGRTVTGGGLVTGGGPLTGDLVLTVPAATVSDFRVGADVTKALTIGTAYSALAEVALAYSGSNVVTSGDAAPDLAKFNNAAVALTVNSTLPNPVNHKVGQEGIIRISHTGGPWTLAFGNIWKRVGGPPSLSGQTDLLVFKVITPTLILYDLRKNPT